MKPPLSPARLWWKNTYRQLRIIRREATKAAMDTMIFGTGFCRIGEDVPDLIERIPPERVFHDLDSGEVKIV